MTTTATFSGMDPNGRNSSRCAGARGPLRPKGRWVLVSGGRHARIGFRAALGRGAGRGLRPGRGCGCAVPPGLSRAGWSETRAAPTRMGCGGIPGPRRAWGREVRELPRPARAARCGPAAEQRREATPRLAAQPRRGGGGHRAPPPACLLSIAAAPAPLGPAEPPRAGWGRAGPGGPHCLRCPAPPARAALPGGARSVRELPVLGAGGAPSLGPQPRSRGRPGARRGGKRSLSGNKENLAGWSGGDAQP